MRGFRFAITVDRQPTASFVLHCVFATWWLKISLRLSSLCAFA
jgi:hypothetical protein